jgi:hypothetical protein
MSTVNTWMDEHGAMERYREPIDVVLSKIILAFGMSVALGMIVMSIVWSSSPPNSQGRGDAVHRGAWRSSHQFRAVARTAASAEPAGDYRPA